MQRAQRTAALAGFPDYEVTPLLREYDYGDYEGMTTPDIRAKRPDWDLFRDGCPGGETPDQVYARARAFVDKCTTDATSGGAIVDKSGTYRAIAFAHGHILRTVAAAWLGEPVLLAARLSLDTAALCTLSDGDRGRVVQLWNSTGQP
jgi:probable phosphoglycerate mutase